MTKLEEAISLLVETNHLLTLDETDTEALSRSLIILQSKIETFLGRNRLLN